MRYMRIFYEAWQPTFTALRNSSATADELQEPQKIDTTELLPANRQPAAGEITHFNISEFLSLSFTHHIEILSKAKDMPSRLFYIHIAIIGKWSKNMLRDALKADLYHHQGQLPNNFAKTVPISQALKAIQMFKDEYLLDFMNVEELGERDKEDIDERVVEQAIIHNVKNFIMTFGKDFTTPWFSQCFPQYENQRLREVSKSLILRVDQLGLEPRTSRLWVCCSNQLSYKSSEFFNSWCKGNKKDGSKKEF